jgi:hypothetical protein
MDRRQIRRVSAGAASAIFVAALAAVSVAPQTASAQDQPRKVLLPAAIYGTYRHGLIARPKGLPNLSP